MPRSLKKGPYVDEKLLKKIEKMNLSTKRIIGFGIGSKNTYETATQYSNGAIIGSSFIKNLKSKGLSSINGFIKSIRD
jgi:tryptophan synthase alpha chain